MRSMDYLVQLFPNKTGKELLEIQKQDKRDDELEYQKENEEKLKFINDINTNGGYYCGRFGFDQRFYYRVFNAILDTNGRVYIDVEKLVVFINDSGQQYTTTKEGDLHIERSTSTYQDEDKYGLSIYKRVTKKEWDEVNDYLNNVTKFWGSINEY